MSGAASNKETGAGTSTMDDAAGMQQESRQPRRKRNGPKAKLVMVGNIITEPDDYYVNNSSPTEFVELMNFGAGKKELK